MKPDPARQVWVGTYRHAHSKLEGTHSYSSLLPELGRFDSAPQQSLDDKHELTQGGRCQWREQLHITQQHRTALISFHHSTEADTHRVRLRGTIVCISAQSGGTVLTTDYLTRPCAPVGLCELRLPHLPSLTLTFRVGLLEFWHISRLSGAP